MRLFLPGTNFSPPQFRVSSRARDRHSTPYAEAAAAAPHGLSDNAAVASGKHAKLPRRGGQQRRRGSKHLEEQAMMWLVVLHVP